MVKAILQSEESQLTHVRPTAAASAKMPPKEAVDVWGLTSVQTPNHLVSFDSASDPKKGIPPAIKLLRAEGELLPISDQESFFNAKLQQCDADNLVRQDSSD